MGDQVLRSFAKLLAESVRSTATVARYGGEELAIVLPKTLAGNAFEIAEQIREKIASEGICDTSTGQRPVAVTASLGIAEICNADQKEHLIRRVDRKLYDAKVKDRNLVEIDAITPLAPRNDATTGCALLQVSRMQYSGGPAGVRKIRNGVVIPPAYYAYHLGG